MEKTKNKINYLHIAIIVIGIIFISIPIFHQNLWLDESYSVGIANKSFIDIWTIGGNDVHPVLYYFGLHVLYLLFGSNIYIYRIFSMIPIAILGILGYTHIRKDFGKNTGLLFSLFTFFLPISVVYSGEIRMYTWAMLLITLMAIYAYRIYQKSTNKNWILFAIFSLASAYTHYYGLVTAGIVNAILFIYLLLKTIKAHKIDKTNKMYTPELKRFTISSIIQILLYLPWLLCLIKQIAGVSRGFWIQRPSLKVWLDIFTFQFTGNLDINFLSENLAIIFSCILFIYTIYSVIRAVIKNKKAKNEEKTKEFDIKQNNKPGFLAIGIYIIVVILIFLVSLKTPILYARYFLNLTGLFIFFIAFFMAKGGRKVLTVIISIITIIVAIIVNINITKMNYDKSNQEPLAYVQENLQDGDMILFGNEGCGFVLSMQLINFPNCFFDGDHWNVDAAYQAFGKDLLIIKNLEPLDNYQGRIWVINGSSFTIYNELKERECEKVKLIMQQRFSTEYHKYQYTITLIEKE